MILHAVAICSNQQQSIESLSRRDDEWEPMQKY